jgi:hypothetical protein
MRLQQYSLPPTRTTEESAMDSHSLQRKNARKHKRSAAASIARARKKAAKIRKLICETPFTLTDRKNWTVKQPPRYVYYPLEVADLRGGVLAKYLPNVVPSQLLDQLMSSTAQLHKSLSPKKDRTCRGKQQCYYLGFWRESVKEIRQTPLSKTEPAQQWVNANQQLFQFVSMQLKARFPQLFQVYQRIPSEYRPFGIWSFAVINWQSTSILHVDAKDWRNGFCCVLPFADSSWTGAELVFPALNLTVNLQNKDLVFFQSHLLQHGNKELQNGTRNSLVLVSHNNLFNVT